MKIDINMVTTNKDYKLCLEIEKVFEKQNIDENLKMMIMLLMLVI